MPFGDGTGPEGKGPNTGRGAGFCKGYDLPGSLQPGNRGRRPCPPDDQARTGPRNSNRKNGGQPRQKRSGGRRSGR